MLSYRIFNVIFLTLGLACINRGLHLESTALTFGIVIVANLFMNLLINIAEK